MAAATAHPLDTGTRLAVDRTRMAYERTMMAWVRTATSLISFGFTVYKFFEFEEGRNAVATGGLLSPRRFAIIMIGTGLVALVLSTIEYRRDITRLQVDSGGEAHMSVAGVVAAIVSVLGLLALIATLLNA
jgi:putative membrane protein